MRRWRVIHPNTVTWHGFGLTGAPTGVTRVEQGFDLDATRKLKREPEHDIIIRSGELARLALASDLVDECQLVLKPVIVGGRKAGIPSRLTTGLELP